MDMKRKDIECGYDFGCFHTAKRQHLFPTKRPNYRCPAYFFKQLVAFSMNKRSTYYKSPFLSSCILSQVWPVHRPIKQMKQTIVSGRHSPSIIVQRFLYLLQLSPLSYNNLSTSFHCPHHLRRCHSCCNQETVSRVPGWVYKYHRVP